MAFGVQIVAIFLALRAQKGKAGPFPGPLFRSDRCTILSVPCLSLCYLLPAEHSSFAAPEQLPSSPQGQVWLRDVPVPVPCLPLARVRVRVRDAPVPSFR
jgi:hypothetical protein